MKLTLRQLLLILPDAEPVASQFIDPINLEIEKSNLTTPARLAAFLAQVGYETQSLTKLKENLNYSVEALLSKFSRKRISEADARLYGRIDGKRKADQTAIANILYGGEFGRKELGNTGPNDGARYPGRGALHTTGLWNYAATGKQIGLDLVNNPEQLEQPGPAIRSAGFYWTMKSLNTLADKGDINGISSVINTGKLGNTALGQDDRRDIYLRALRILTAG